jgi:hypothetical protein
MAPIFARNKPAQTEQPRYCFTFNFTMFERPPLGWRACRVNTPGCAVISAGMRAVNSVWLM